MHGSPFRQFLLTLAGVIMLGCFLFAATRPAKHAEKPPTPPSTSQDNTIPTFMSVKYAHKPLSLRISLAEEKAAPVLYQGSPTEMEISTSIDIPRKPATTIIVEASWPEGTPDTPISITLEPDGLPSRTSTNWSISRELHNTYLFSW